MLGAFVLFSSISLPFQIALISISVIFFILSFFKIPIKNLLFLRVLSIFAVISMLASFCYFDFLKTATRGLPERSFIFTEVACSPVVS